MRASRNSLATCGLLLCVGTSAAGTIAELDTIQVRGERRRVIEPPVPFPSLAESTAASLEFPSRVTVALVEPLHRANFHEGDPRKALPAVVGYTLRSERRALPSDRARRAGRLILSEQYWNPGTKACIFNPNVAYFVEGRGRIVTVLVCHSCAAAMFVMSGQWVTSRNLDHVNRELIEVERAIFPDDSTLIALHGRTLHREQNRVLHGAGTWVPPD